MARCTNTEDLGVYHKNGNGNSSLFNAIVLCRACYEAILESCPSEDTLQPFLEETKNAALRIARNQCQCTRNNGCHQIFTDLK
jgi:hypothetical protein